MGRHPDSYRHTRIAWACPFAAEILEIEEREGVFQVPLGKISNRIHFSDRDGPRQRITYRREQRVSGFPCLECDPRRCTRKSNTDRHSSKGLGKFERLSAEHYAAQAAELSSRSCSGDVRFLLAVTKTLCSRMLAAVLGCKV
jgi:hypothetical protein